MLDERIVRLNELAKKSKTPEGLTPEETAERDALRREYIEAYKSSLRAQLDATVIQTPDGSRHKLTRRTK